MSKIDELIQEYCPNGVEFKFLWEVTAWDKKFNAVDSHKQAKTYKYTYLLASALRKLAVEGGDVKLLSTGGEVYGWTTEELAGKSLSEGEVVAIPWGGKATVQYYNGKFVTADNRIATSLDKKRLDNKYLYYFMLSELSTIQSFYRGSGIQHPSMAKVLDMRIPVPPLEVQEEIVKILDTFTELEAELAAELAAELEARRTQYEHYRSHLLSTISDTGQVLLGDIATIGTGSHDTKDAVNDGTYVFYARGREPLRLDSFDFNECAIITAGDGVGVGKVFHFANGEYALHQRAYRIVPSARVDARYLYHYLIADFGRYLERTSVHASVTSLRRPMFLKYPVSLPSLGEQRRVSAILDKFDALVNDISTGLPVEITARRQQYEYYRNKLLTFKELAS